ncbi:Carboxylesterase family protein [Alkalibacterium subtropicum]|uniref:Carboxylesterase family protein n=1 Tax=Alkalibacterium subtropicum TaxID=753702 RepID=A0A1I1J710_9LACT|nr:alpha/beta hydrolase [Alkalibacterium subtropicum]SFC44236.1 Carboxylesterase family protein [Alkalibacterium subtropicum]
MNRFLKSLAVMNSVSLVLSLFYVLSPEESVFWNAYGILVILTLTGNSVAATLRTDQKKGSALYLVLSSAGMTGVAVLTTLASLDPADQASRSLVGIVLFLSLFLVGTLLAGTSFVHTNRRGHTSHAPSRQTDSTPKKVMRIMLQILLGLSLLVGVLLAVSMVTNVSVGVVEAAVSPYSLFYSFIFLSTAGLFLKVSPFDWRSSKGISVLLIGTTLYVVFALPFFSIPMMLEEAEENYTAAFGNDWQDEDDTIPAFKELPVSLPAFFFGSPSGNYELEEDVQYYAGDSGVDEGLDLRFDVYTPTENAADLPGQGSVLIRIHGGGWNSGDKGPENFSQVNKYFAEQGYVVFDVQYGLNAARQFSGILSAPDDVTGDFSVRDMVRHLGLFTTYLADNHERFDADIDSVFISGGSAGGHLANALALGASSGQYPELIDTRITVKGIIPFYPANGLAGFPGVGDAEELIDPDLLVEEDSPPALVYQGDLDTLVEPQVTIDFKEAYVEANNSDIAIIWLPYGSHASDLYFTGVYNQTFMYYMERFMYQFR